MKLYYKLQSRQPCDPPKQSPGEHRSVPEYGTNGTKVSLRQSPGSHDDDDDIVEERGRSHSDNNIGDEGLTPTQYALLEVKRALDAPILEVKVKRG